MATFAHIQQQASAPDKQQISIQLKNHMAELAAHQYRTLCDMQKFGIQNIWYHEHLTPQEAVDAAFGNEAVKMFAVHAELTGLIVALAALDSTPENPVMPDILLPTHSWTNNEDGTVTILDAPYTP